VVGGATAGSMRTPEEVNGAWDSVAALGLPPHMRTLLEEAKVNAAALRTQRDRNAELLASLHAHREQVRRLEAKCTRLQATLEKCEVSAERALSEERLLADLASKDAAVEELRKQVDIAVKAREADQRVRRRDAMLAVKADESAKADLEALKRSLESKDAETRAAHLTCRETQRAFDAFQRKVRAEKAKAAESAAERAAAEAARIEAERIEAEQQAAAKIAAEQAAQEMAEAQAAAEAAAIEAAAKQAQLDAARRAQEEEQRTAAAIAAEKDRQRRMIFDAAAAAREAKAVREAFAFKDKRERQAAAAERRKQAAAAAKARSDAVLAGTFGVVGGATLPSPRNGTGTGNATVRQVPPPLLRATTATGAPSSRSPSPGTSRRAVAQPSDGASSAVSASTTASTIVSGVDGVRSSSAGDGTGGRKKRRSKRKHRHPLPPPPPKVWGTDFIAPCDWRI
jgi:chemotaxis protein histidine kinase CheA